MRRLLIVTSVGLSLSACSGRFDSGSDGDFTYVRVASGEAPILLERKTGCSWLLMPNWSVEDDGKEFSPSDEIDVAIALDQYALVAVKSGNAARCQEKFGLAAKHGLGTRKVERVEEK